jgi:hypothetical protein
MVSHENMSLDTWNGTEHMESCPLLVVNLY